MIVQQAVIRQIICPVCDAAVRPADETPCPNCRTCPSCGRKLPRGEPTCWCGFSDEPEKVAELVRRFGVSDEYAELAARKFASRKRLERKKSLVICALGALMIVPNVILGGSRHFQSVGDFVVRRDDYCGRVWAAVLCLHTMAEQGRRETAPRVPGAEH